MHQTACARSLQKSVNRRRTTSVPQMTPPESSALKTTQPKVISSNRSDHLGLLLGACLSQPTVAIFAGSSVRQEAAGTCLFLILRIAETADTPLHAAQLAESAAPFAQATALPKQVMRRSISLSPYICIYRSGVIALSSLRSLSLSHLARALKIS